MIWVAGVQLQMSVGRAKIQGEIMHPPPSLVHPGHFKGRGRGACICSNPLRLEFYTPLLSNPLFARGHFQGQGVRTVEVYEIPEQKSPKMGKNDKIPLPARPPEIREKLQKKKLQNCIFGVI